MGKTVSVLYKTGLCCPYTHSDFQDLGLSEAAVDGRNGLRWSMKNSSAATMKNFRNESTKVGGIQATRICLLSHFSISFQG